MGSRALVNQSRATYNADISNTTTSACRKRARKRFDITSVSFRLVGEFAPQRPGFKAQGGYADRSGCSEGSKRAQENRLCHRGKV